jgi:hypothetical protein
MCMSVCCVCWMCAGHACYIHNSVCVCLHVRAYVTTLQGLIWPLYAYVQTHIDRLAAAICVQNMYSWAEQDCPGPVGCLFVAHAMNFVWVHLRGHWLILLQPLKSRMQTSTDIVQSLVMLRSCMLGLKCIHNSVYACMFDDLCVYAYDPAISSLWPCFSLFLFFQCCFGCYIMWGTFCFKYIGILNKCMYASHTCMSSFMHACARFSTCTKSGTSWVHTKRVWLLLGIMVQQFNDSFFVIQYVCMPVYLHAQSSMAASNWWG